MPTARRWFLSSPVALRKESVDRNTRLGVQATAKVVSLSARRAWIEMRMNNYSASTRSVALRKESVDRNISPENGPLPLQGRSPQGERG